MDEEIKSAGETAKALGELIKAAGDSAEAKEAAKNLGRTAVTVTRALNTILLPIAAVNFAFEKARAYFNDGRFQQDLLDRTKDIPLDAVVEPKASIAAPLLQGLAFAHEEAPLKEMYLALLAQAMDGRGAEAAHPAYVEILRQLNASEANALIWLLGAAVEHPIVQVRSRMPEDTRGWRLEANNVMSVQVSDDDDAPDVSPEWKASLDNFQRLGLIDIGYEKFLAHPNAYDWTNSRPEYLDATARCASMIPPREVFVQRGHVSPTLFGTRFAKAAGLDVAAIELRRRQLGALRRQRLEVGRALPSNQGAAPSG